MSRSSPAPQELVVAGNFTPGTSAEPRERHQVDTVSDEPHGPIGQNKVGAARMMAAVALVVIAVRLDIAWVVDPPNSASGGVRLHPLEEGAVRRVRGHLPCAD